MSEDILGRLDHFIRHLAFLSELYSDSEVCDSPGERYGYYLTLCDILYDLESIERAIRAKLEHRPHEIIKLHAAPAK